MDKKIKVEKKFLFETKDLIQELFQEHCKTGKNKIDAFTKAKIKGLITRVMDQEVEYLHDDPESYFELYGEDHLKN